MAKVLSCIAKQSQDGTKTYYNVALQKGDTQIGAFAFEQVAPGEEVDDSRIVPDKQGTGWIIKSASKGGGFNKSSYQKNDDLIIAQVAFKGMVELVNGGKMAAKDISTETCVTLAQIIKRTEAAIKVAPPKAPAPAAAPSAAARAVVGKPFPEEPDDIFPDDPPPAAPPPADINLADLGLVDWSLETQSYYLNTLVKVSVSKGMLPPQVKQFLKEKFKVEDSRGITIGMRNEVMKSLIAEAK